MVRLKSELSSGIALTCEANAPWLFPDVVDEYVSNPKAKDSSKDSKRNIRKDGGNDSKKEGEKDGEKQTGTINPSEIFDVLVRMPGLKQYKALLMRGNYGKPEVLVRGPLQNSLDSTLLELLHAVCSLNEAKGRAGTSKR